MAGVVRPMAAVSARVIASGPAGMATSSPTQVVDGIVEVGARHDPVREAGAQQLVGLDRTAGHHPVAGERQPDLADEQRHAGPRERDADGQLGDADHGVVGRDADVARRGEQRCPTDDVAVEPGDGGLRDAAELVEQPLPRAGAVAAGGPVDVEVGVGRAA